MYMVLQCSEGRAFVVLDFVVHGLVFESVDYKTQGPRYLGTRFVDSTLQAIGALSRDSENQVLDYVAHGLVFESVAIRM